MDPGNNNRTSIQNRLNRTQDGDMAKTAPTARSKEEIPWLPLGIPTPLRPRCTILPDDDQRSGLVIEGAEAESGGEFTAMPKFHGLANLDDTQDRLRPSGVLPEGGQRLLWPK